MVARLPRVACGVCGKTGQVPVPWSRAGISMDMSKTYRSAAGLCFPKATVVYDHFHVKKLMLDAMDMVRREEQGRKMARSRNAGRKLMMIPEYRMNEQQKEKNFLLAGTGEFLSLVYFLFMDNFLFICSIV